MTPDIVESITAGFVTMVVFGSFFGFLAFRRYLRHKETMELARQGIVHPRYRRTQRSGDNRAYRAGVITAAVGLAMTFGLLTLGIGPWLLPGFVPLAVGVALVLTASRGSGEEEMTENWDIKIDDDPIPPHKQ